MTEFFAIFRRFWGKRGKLAILGKNKVIYTHALYIFKERAHVRIRETGMIHKKIEPEWTQHLL